jgi:hypothetical protein
VLAQIEDRSGLPKWKEVESMLVALGATVEEHEGSRIGVVLEGVPAVFHRPHPSPEIHKAQRNTIRNYLVQTGVIT